MDRGSIELPPRASESPSLNLQDEALEEVRRCDALRARSSNRSHSSARLLLCREPRATETFMVLVAGRLCDSTGGVIHSSLVALRMHCRLNRLPVSHADWRTVARELGESFREVWLTHAKNATDETVAAAAAQYRGTTEALARRDAAILDLRRPSPSLVQAALFDSRELQRQIDRRHTTALWAEATTQRAHSVAHAAGVQAVYEIVAIR
jgi:hypothetical protein